MKGLDLSEKYFFDIGLKMLKNKFPNYLDHIAAGLVGEGSECYGFDDEISWDHDWGAGFCLWLTRKDYSKIGESLKKEYNQLRKEFKGYPARITTSLSQQRVGVFEIYSFYKQFTGLNNIPHNLFEWLRIPEEYLSIATNGKVFMDSLGLFSSIRGKLKNNYPEDVRIKKIAARCMTAGQSGQYNFSRNISRKEYVAAHYSLSKFIQDSISLIFLLNRRYKPFYKWMHRALLSLPALGISLYPIYEAIVVLDFKKDRIDFMYQQIETICKKIAEELVKQGLSNANSDFLCDHGPILKIKLKIHHCALCM